MAIFYPAQGAEEHRQAQEKKSADDGPALAKKEQGR
jgi:hypothetical protein